MKKHLLTTFFLGMTAIGCGPIGGETSTPSSLVTKGARWAKPSEIPVCIVNRSDVSDEIANDVKTFVTNEYAKTNVRFTRFDACTSADMSALMIRIFFRKIHEWNTTGGISAGGGLSWIGPVAASCGTDCGGGTMYVNIGKGGIYPTNTLRQFAIGQTRLAAVHEFGHALGLAHEQDRADAPQCGGIKGSVTDGSSYIFVGDYDPSSVMNYCKSGNINSLPAGDIGGLAFLYPTPITTTPTTTTDPTKTDTTTPPGSVVLPPAVIYSLVARSDNKCAEVKDASKLDFASIIQAECVPLAPAQNIKLVDVGGGAFTLQNINSGKCYGVASASRSNGATVVQSECKSTAEQKVVLRAANDGNSLLRFGHTNKCLTISRGILTQNRCVNTATQQFKLIRRN